MAHEVAAQCLRDGHDANIYPNLDSSIVEGVQLYLDTIRNDMKQRGGKLEVETKFRMSDLHSLFWGTADAVLMTDAADMLVYDLKMGRGQIVEVLSGNGPNVQLAFYALGALHNYAGRRVKSIELVLIQPRAWHRDGPVRRVHVDRDEMDAFRDRLVQAAAEAEKPDAKLVPGDHCRFCAAMAGCPAIHSYAIETAQMDFGTHTATKPSTLDVKHLGNILDHIDIIEEWIAAVRAHAHAVAAGPEGLPGWKLVDKQGRRQWIDKKQVVRQLYLLWGLDEKEVFERSLKSPAQVEKLLLPDQRKDPDFKSLCPSVSSGKTLVRADNPHKEAKKSPEQDYV